MPRDSLLRWSTKLRLRAWVFVIGVPLAVWGAIAAAPAWLALPLVGVGLTAVVAAVNSVGSRLSARSCWTCGHDLSREAPGEQGIACPCCGSLNQFNPRLLAMRDNEPAWPELGGDDEPAPTEQPTRTDRA